MVWKNSPKRSKQMDGARSFASKAGNDFLDPAILFGRASDDDLSIYSPEMLGIAAGHAANRLKTWDRIRADITVTQIPGVEPAGISVWVLTVIDRNMPFLFDSVMGEITASHRGIAMAVHPILTIEPGKAPVLRSNDEPTDPAHQVSLIQLHISQLNEEQGNHLIERIRFILDQVHLAITDWSAMLDTLDGAAKQLLNARPRKGADREEALAFLDWLRDDNFTFLGMREYVYSGKGSKANVERGKGRGLGTLSDPDVLVLRQGKDQVTTTPEILEFLDGPQFLIVAKANVKSVVHRRAYMDYIGVKRFDESGHVVGELRIVGLFTATAYTQSVREIP